MSVKPDVYQVQKARSLKTIIGCSKQKERIQVWSYSTSLVNDRSSTGIILSDKCI